MTNLNHNILGVPSENSKVTLISISGYTAIELGIKIGEQIYLVVNSTIIQAVVIATSFNSNGNLSKYVILGTTTNIFSSYIDGQLNGIVNGRTVRLEFVGSENASYEAFEEGINPHTIYDISFYYSTIYNNKNTMDLIFDYVNFLDLTDNVIYKMNSNNGDLYWKGLKLMLAINVEYDNSMTLLSATNLQDAVDEIYTLIGTGSGLSPGTTIGNTLYWNGIAWIETIRLTHTNTDTNLQFNVSNYINLNSTGFYVVGGNTNANIQLLGLDWALQSSDASTYSTIFNINSSSGISSWVNLNPSGNTYQKIDITPLLIELQSIDNGTTAYTDFIISPNSLLMSVFDGGGSTNSMSMNGGLISIASNNHLWTANPNQIAFNSTNFITNVTDTFFNQTFLVQGVNSLILRYESIATPTTFNRIILSDTTVELSLINGTTNVSNTFQLLENFGYWTYVDATNSINSYINMGNSGFSLHTQSSTEFIDITATSFNNLLIKTGDNAITYGTTVNQTTGMHQITVFDVNTTSVSTQTSNAFSKSIASSTFTNILNYTDSSYTNNITNISTSAHLNNYYDSTVYYTTLTDITGSLLSQIYINYSLSSLVSADTTNDYNTSITTQPLIFTLYSINPASGITNVTGGGGVFNITTTDLNLSKTNQFIMNGSLITSISESHNWNSSPNSMIFDNTHFTNNINDVSFNNTIMTQTATSFDIRYSPLSDPTIINKFAFDTADVTMSVLNTSAGLSNTMTLLSTTGSWEFSDSNNNITTHINVSNSGISIGSNSNGDITNIAAGFGTLTLATISGGFSTSLIQSPTSFHVGVNSSIYNNNNTIHSNSTINIISDNIGNSNTYTNIIDSLDHTIVTATSTNKLLLNYGDVSQLESSSTTALAFLEVDSSGSATLQVNDAPGGGTSYSQVGIGISNIDITSSDGTSTTVLSSTPTNIQLVSTNMVNTTSVNLTSQQVNITGGRIESVNYQTVTPYEILYIDYKIVMDVNAGTIKLPDAPQTGQTHIISNTNATSLTIDGNGKIVSIASLTLAQYESVELTYVASQSTWYPF